MTAYNIINYKYPCVLIVHFYRLVQFHTQRGFCASIYVKLSNSGHPVMYSRQFCINKPGQKIYLCMSTRSTRHHMLLHNPTILHTKTFFAPACQPRKKISSNTKLSQSSLIHPRSPHTSSSTSKYDSNANPSQKFSFSFFRVRFRVTVMVTVVVTVQSATCPQ